MTQFWRMPVGVLSGLLNERAVSSAQLLDHFLQRIARLDGALNTVIAFNPAAHGQAAASDRRRARGESLGPLDGVPITVKDNILTGDIPTRWGSAVYADGVPDADETPVARLKAAGMVILGKTNVPEFTLEGITDNPLFGPTRNPWDPSVTPGGSSGGAVSGVAAGLFPAAIGTDGGGSIRRPCGYTGLFGLKPSIGRVARVETLPQILFDMETVGPIARDVAGAALVFDAMAGPAAHDPRSWLPAEPNSGSPLDAPPHAMRILYVERFGEAPLDPAIAASLRTVAQRFEDLGHRVETGVLPLDIAALNAHWPCIGEAGLAFAARMIGAGFSAASPKFRAMAQRGDSRSAGEMFQIFDLIARLRRQAAACFADWDVILTPSCACMPWPVGVDWPEVIDRVAVGPRGHAVYTGWVNAIAHPAINLPAPPAESGMPVGAHLVAAFNRDRLLLRLARQYETSYPWAGRWPDLAETPRAGPNGAEFGD